MQDAVPLKAKRFRIKLGRKSLLLAAIVVAAAAGLGTGLYFWMRGDGESVRVVTGVQFPYPEGWTEQPLTDADRKAGLLLKLDRQQPAASFLARTVIARLDPAVDVNKLTDDTVAALSAEIENFELVSKEVLPVGPYNAVRINYRQAGVEGAAGHQNLMVIVPTANQTFYLTLRAERGDFRRVEDEGLQIIEDFVAYVASVR